MIASERLVCGYGPGEEIVKGVDFALAAVTGAGIDMADAQGTAQDRTYLLLQSGANPQAVITFRRGFADDADRCDLSECFQHGGTTTSRGRCRRG